MTEHPCCGAGGIIDVHHHIMPPAYLTAHRPEIAGIMPGFTQTLDWTPQWSIDHLDQSGGRAAVVSLSAPGVWFGDGADAAYLARASNEFAAGMVQAHPGRFGFFATLPWVDVEATLAEIAYAFDELDADGVGLITTHGGRYPGEPEFRPIWEELNRRQAIVYFHPTSPACCAGLVKGLPPAALEFPFDSTRAIASLLTGLVFSDNPAIRFIFSHGGGALPTLAERLAVLASIRPDIAARYRGSALAELKRLNFDIASVTNPGAWAGLTTLVPNEQILFGTDYPFGSIVHTDQQLRALQPSSQAYDQITHLNAEALFPRLAAVRS
jgi:predicted TIM-barrel fold metal-dependent hydrolase